MEKLRLLEKFAQDYPNKLAVVSAEEQISWKDFTTRVKTLISELCVAEFKGKTIAAYISQDIASVTLFIAASFVDKTAVFIPSFNPLEKVKQYANQLDLNVLVSNTNKGIKVLYQNKAAIDQKARAPDQAKLGILTSGTTGKPKCALHTLDSLTKALRFEDKFSSKTWLLGYPTAHFAGSQVVYQALFNGGTLGILKDFSAKECFKMLNDYDFNYFNCTPTLIRQSIMNYKPNDFKNVSLESITLGGELVDQATIDLIKNYLPKTHLSWNYGSTEVGSVMQVTDEKEGFPIKFIDNKLFKIEKDELYVMKNPRSMQHYMKQKEAVDESWQSTKDIVEVIGDRVYFRGRKDDIINVGGFKVYPVVVEAVIKKIPQVKDVVIMAEANPLVGNLIKAYICLADKEQKQNEISKQIVALCKQELTYYMVPKLFSYVDKLPVSKVNKKLRR